MLMEDVLSELQRIITQELRLGEGMVITAESTLSGLGIDSIALMQLLVFVEENFDFEFDENAMTKGNITNLGSLAQYILVKKSGKPMVVAN